MQGAYLVQLGRESREELTGRVEEIDSGRAARGPDAQLPRRDGLAELADGGILSPR